MQFKVQLYGTGKLEQGSEALVKVGFEDVDNVGQNLPKWIVRRRLVNSKSHELMT